MRIPNGLQIYLGLVVGVLCTLTGRTITPVDSVIQNVATAVYKNDDDVPFTSVSNRVEVNVRQVFAIQIKPDGSRETPGQTFTGLPGEEIEIPYTLSNPGNGVDSYTLLLDSADLINSRIVIDEEEVRAITVMRQD